MDTYNLMLFAFLDVVLVLIGMILIRQKTVIVTPLVAAPAIASPRREMPEVWDPVSIDRDENVFDNMSTLVAKGYQVVHVGRNRIRMAKRLGQTGTSYRS
jgi:hypothetical protein